MKLILSVLCVFLCSSSIFAEDTSLCTRGPRSLRINGKNVSLREEPNTKSKVIKYLNTGDKVYFMKRNPKSEIINGKKGNWIYVNCDSDDERGWVFDYYVLVTIFPKERIEKKMNDVELVTKIELNTNSIKCKWFAMDSDYNEYEVQDTYTIYTNGVIKKITDRGKITKSKGRLYKIKDYYVADGLSALFVFIIENNTINFLIIDADDISPEPIKLKSPIQTKYITPKSGK